jgi:hypothetical protein
MKHRFSALGWLVAALVLLVNASVTVAAPSLDNPLEGHLLQHSGGVVYLYHAGSKFTVQVADVGDHVIDAIPTAADVEWQALFGDTPAPRRAPSPGQEQPAPANS